MPELHSLALSPEKCQHGIVAQRVDIVIGDPEEALPKQHEPAIVSEKQDDELNGWMTVAGSWLILFSTLGYIYSFGVYEGQFECLCAHHNAYKEDPPDYYTRIFLTGHSPSSIAWMGSFQLALPFAMGPFAGRIFDAGYARLTIAAGSFLFVFSLFMLSLAQEGQYYQGVGMGAGTGLLFTPSTAVKKAEFGVWDSINRNFYRRLGFSNRVEVNTILPSSRQDTDTATTSQLIPKLGFPSAVRVTGFITLGCLLAGNALIRPQHHTSVNQRSADISTFFHDPVYLWFLLMAVVSLLGIYFPAIYLQLYAVDHKMGNSLAFYSIAILNGVGIVGRVGSTWLADQYGIWNVQIPVTLGTAATIWAIIGTHNPATLVVISCLYGIFSGAWLAVSISGLVSLASSPSEVGARVGVANAFMSVGLLVSGPVQGALLSSRFDWIRPIVFSATLMSISTLFSIIIRTLISRRKNSQRI
ncbi:hypothetical protein D9756_005302 [Leucocoprinus leucothites]|uniref:MFS general substrate transporter n=1 Tax=Leucocoprinus leucothites TaxID=201217 RepID=A0A8H5FZP0_9AGAR|nr:hypothetical protein D9756_005302 [Leucoagaricus leucothites]